ncbi:MAG TPA: nucleoside deaminase [Saprospiraceae bacterium]|nr:nucleoside deaminase [Saprospiraceae bacterium]
MEEIANTQDKKFIARAITLAQIGVNANAGGPFGAVIVKNGVVIAEAHNEVLQTNDPTAHAEVTAIRRACQSLQSFQLDDCILYTSCEPCPMCLGAIYWARPKKVFYACSKKDAAAVGFDDDFIYQELDLNTEDRSIPMVHIHDEEAMKPFKLWDDKEDKKVY